MAKIALLIGVSHYTSGFAPLPSAVRDVQAMSRVLERSDIGGFDRVQLLQDPDRQSMDDAIETLFTNCRKDDLVLLFFSGHGVIDEEGNLYFAASNSRKDEKGKLVKVRAVPARLVQQFMENCRSKRQVVILDCCFSGAFAEGMKAKDDGSVDIRSQLGGEGRVVLTSSSSTQYSFEQQGLELSIYTHYLVEGIETGDADQDRDGFIGVSELHDYAKRRVQELKPEMNPEKYHAKEGYKILLARTPSTDPVMRYSLEVRRLAGNGEIRFDEQTVLDQVQDWLNLPRRENVRMSSTRRKALDAFRLRLGLSQEIASRIEAETLQPYREFYKNLALYKQEFAGKIRWGKPLTDFSRRELKDLQRMYGISNENAAYAEQQTLQRMQRFPYSGIQSFYRLLNPAAFLLLLGSAAIVFLGIEVFKAAQERFQVDQQAFPTTESPITISPSVDVYPQSSDKASPSPSTTPDLQSEAMNSLQNRNYQEAINLYQQAIKINPQSADSYAGIGIANYQLAEQLRTPGDLSTNTRNLALKSAIENLEQAIKLKVFNSSLIAVQTYVYLGHVYLAPETENASKAYSAYSHAIQLNPTGDLLAIAYMGRANARLKWADDKIGARNDYEKAKTLYVEANNNDGIIRVTSELQKLQ